MFVHERYSPIVVGVDTIVTFLSKNIGGFAAKTSGTVTIVDSAGTTIISAYPVTAGVYHPFPFYIGAEGGTITTAGGASGTLAG